jgi:hypothetical protein
MADLPVPLRRFFGALLVLLLAVLLAACAGLGGPTVVTIGEAELAALVERRFPFDRRILEVIDVRVGTPRLTLLPERNRLATELQVEMSDRVFRRGFSGRIALDYALRYDAPTQAMVLTDVRVGSLQIDTGVPSITSAANAIGPLIVEKLLNDAAIYRFKPEQLQGRFGGRIEPGAVVVTPRGVEITLQPVR